MQRTIYLTTILTLILFHSILSAQVIEGTVKYPDPAMNNMEMPLMGASVSLLNSSLSTFSDSNGNFQISFSDSSFNKLIVSYVGFKTDTVIFKGDYPLKINLQPSMELSGVTIQDNKTSYLSGKPINILNINSGELIKAACCNLGETFTTTPQVDVQFSDAVTGVRQIQLLGLAGFYTPILTENVNQLIGLAKGFGLDYIPGAWIESMQLTQGIGSVAAGYEGINGQLNVELIKPDSKNQLLVKLFANQFGRFTLSALAPIHFSSKVNTIVFADGDDLSFRHDDNHDGFLDMPLNRQFHFANRWLIAPNASWQIRFGGDYFQQVRLGGQDNFSADSNHMTSSLYGIRLQTNQQSAYAKIGYLNPAKPYHSEGLILSFSDQNQNGYFGRTTYTGGEQNFSANYVYQTILKNTDHQLRFGASFLYDKIDESINFFNLNPFLNPIHQNSEGAFAEYTYSGIKWNLIAGVRGDYQNEYKWILTPRLLVKYSASKNTTLKFSAGSAFHRPDIVTENLSLLASSRQWVVSEPLDADKGWNLGAVFQQDFYIKQHSGEFIINAYHTFFTSQVIADVDSNYSAVYFYNLEGKSFANNILVETDYSPLKNVNLKLAYRYNDVEQTENSVLIEKALIARHKLFANGDYTFDNDKILLNVTWQWYSPQRLPTYMSQNDVMRDVYSPSYSLLYGQINYKLKKLTLFLGGENLLNTTQSNPIINSSAPFDSGFDSSIIWGQVNGINIYGGIMLKL